MFLSNVSIANFEQVNVPWRNISILQERDYFVKIVRLTGSIQFV